MLLQTTRMLLQTNDRLHTLYTELPSAQTVLAWQLVHITALPSDQLTRPAVRRTITAPRLTRLF